MLISMIKWLAITGEEETVINEQRKMALQQIPTKKYFINTQPTTSSCGSIGMYLP